MSFLEDIFSQVLIDGVWLTIKQLGAGIRWLFLRKNYSFKEIEKQNWNGRIGLLTIFLIIIALYNTRQYWFMIF